MRLIWTSNIAAGSTWIRIRSAISAARRSLLRRLAAAKRSRKPASSASGASACELLEIADPALADRRVISSESPGLHWSSQRLAVMPLVLLVMRPGKGAVQVAEHGPLHELGVERRDAVDLVRADERQVAHAHPMRRCR